MTYRTPISVRTTYGVLHLILYPCVDGDSSVMLSYLFGTSPAQDLLKPLNRFSHTPCRNSKITSYVSIFASRTN